MQILFLCQFSDLTHCILSHTGEEVVELVSNNSITFSLINSRGGPIRYARVNRSPEAKDLLGNRCFLSRPDLIINFTAEVLVRGPGKQIF